METIVYDSFWLKLLLSVTLCAELSGSVPTPDHCEWWLDRLGVLSELEEQRIEAMERMPYEPEYFHIAVGAWGQMQQLQQEMIRARPTRPWWKRWKR